MNKYSALILPPLTGLFSCLCFAMPTPPPGVDMVQMSGGFLSSDTQSKRMLKPFTTLGIARAGSPLCDQSTDCTYVWIESVVLNLSTSIGSGEGTINIVDNSTLPTLPPGNIVKTFQFHEKLDFTKLPLTTIVTVSTKKGPVYFKEIIHIPMPASSFNGGCPTEFCYSTVGDGLGENEILPIYPDQEVFGYTTSLTYLIHLP